MSRTDGYVIICEQCARPHRWQSLALREVARCTRCEAILGRGHHSLDHLLALTVAAAAAFVVVLVSPLFSVGLRGAAEASTLPQAILETWNDGQPLIAAVAGATALVAPALFIGLRLYVLIPLLRGHRPARFAECMRALRHIDRWNMVEVFTIGVLLSLVRLAGLADTSPRPGLFALGAMTFIFAAIEASGLKRLWWHAE
ncbi:MAG: paraquat-inducible protein A [Pseudomonadota bacterium]|nr:paraquat-inducible protein A [Pseudomonadota bacterium]